MTRKSNKQNFLLANVKNFKIQNLEFEHKQKFQFIEKYAH